MFRPVLTIKCLNNNQHKNIQVPRIVKFNFSWFNITKRSINNTFSQCQLKINIMTDNRQLLKTVEALHTAAFHNHPIYLASHT